MERLDIETLPAQACHLGEGPSYDHASGVAWWCDILGKALFEWHPSSGRILRHPMKRMPSEIAACANGRQLMALDDGLHLRDPATGELSLIQGIDPDNRHLRSNDGRVHSSGAFWIGTMSLTFEEGAGSVYHFHEGRLTKLFDGFTVPNATCFTADGRTGHIVDSPTGRLLRMAVDPDTGLPDGEPELFHLHEGEGVIDGAVMDEGGTIWCAINGGGAIHAISPEGRVVRRIRIPASQVTCPCFVGDGLDRLMVTTAAEGMPEEERRADPSAGRTFLLDVGARGTIEPLARPI